jgi:hypothetical protein
LAQRNRDALAAIEFLAPDFTMRADGKYVDRDAVAAGIQSSFDDLRLLETQFRDLVVRPIARDVALSSFNFRDSTVTRTGVIKVSRGTTTLIWQKRGGRWLMVFGDADHR